MKKLSIVLIIILSTSILTFAGHVTTVNGYGDSFIFDEDGITFSIYPDGEFDFYIEPVVTSVCVNTPVGGFSFNSGYDYSPYVQYDDYGAVIQVENVPIYYDYYGRVSQIGNVPIHYRNRRINRVGGLYVYYNTHGHYTHCTGFINVWNPYFVYRPHYVYFARPHVNLCFVSLNPYRRHYNPIRYTYYRPYVARSRPHYATVGHTYSPSGHVVSSYYRQAPRSNETAYHRGQRKVTTASVASNRASYNDKAGSDKFRTPSSGAVSSNSNTRNVESRNLQQRETRNGANARSETGSRNQTSVSRRTGSQTRGNNASSRQTTSGQRSSTVNRANTNSKNQSTVRNQNTVTRTHQNSVQSTRNSRSRTGTDNRSRSSNQVRSSSPNASKSRGSGSSNRVTPNSNRSGKSSGVSGSARNGSSRRKG